MSSDLNTRPLKPRELLDPVGITALSARLKFGSRMTRESPRFTAIGAMSIFLPPKGCSVWIAWSI